MATEHYYYARREELMGGMRLSNFIPVEGNSKVVKVKVPSKWVTSSYIALFHKPTGNIVCPHFWEFKPFTGCPFGCSYCYLQGTFRGDKRPRLKGLDRMEKALKDFLNWASANRLKILLNMGELADSLAVPEWTRQVLERVLPVLETYKYHKILLLTKAGTKYLTPIFELNRRYDLPKHLIVSFSVNPPLIVDRYEKYTSHPDDRLEAAKELQESGFQIRIRIDPMIPVDGWRAFYPLLLDSIFNKFELAPERVTLGTLRGLKKTLNFSEDKSWARFLDSREKTEWGLKLPRATRLDMYMIMIRKMRELGFQGPLSLCKETYDLWRELIDRGLIEHPGSRGIWEHVHCNCKL